MDLKNFINKRPYLYHLTHETNYQNILDSGIILSTTKIIEQSGVSNKDEFLRSRREEHTLVNINGVEYHIRDQGPIFPNALKKCVKGGWDSGDFIKHLNDRVFFWSTKRRLQRHYKRYEDENPIIFKISSELLFEANTTPPLFCRLNSGATRPHPYYGGEAPPRGPDTFLEADNYNRNISTIAEVTFIDKCELPQKVELGRSPQGPWNTESL